jgi:hypothetical protein
MLQGDVGWKTRDVIKDDFGGKLLSGRPRASAFTPRTRFYPADAVKTASARTQPSVRADARVRLRGHERVRADSGLRPRGKK